MSDLLMSPNDPSNHLKTLLSATDLEFIKSLHLELNPDRLSLLNSRKERQEVYDKGEVPTYLPESDAQTNWKVKSIPSDLQQRRVEITGPINDKV